MVELRILGTLELKATDGRDLEPLARQSKYTALLCYLAAAVPHGLKRRDTLLALFWPEHDETRARASLSQALYVLRNALGEQAIATRGDGEVGLSRDVVWCDVQAFETAIDAGKPAEALGLYRGGLLDGFHVSGAPEFERWLERERERLRERAADAAWALAESQAATDVVQATRWARWAAALAPADEAVMRRLMTFLHGLGNRAAALRTYEAFAFRLTQEYELEPSAETQALAERIRREKQNAVPAAIPDPQPSSSQAPSPEPSQSHPAPDARRARSRWLLGFAASASITAVALSIWGLSRSARSDTVSPTRIAVFPFSVPGSPEFQDLSAGLMDLVGRSLDGAGELHRVDPNVVLSRLQRLRSTDAPELESARDIARGLGAGHFILGRVVDLGDQVQLSASLYTLSSRAEPEQLTTHVGRLNDLPRLVDSLSHDLLTKLPPAQGVFTTQPEGITSSYGALRNYMRGEALMRRMQWDSASNILDSAVRQDSTFASAWLLLAESRSYEGTIVRRMLATWDRAYRYRNRLSPRERAWLLTGYAFAHGDASAADKAAVAWVDAYPDAAGGWYYLGDGRLWYAWQLGRSITEGDSALVRALTLDPQNQLVQNELALLRYAEGRKAEGDSLWLAARGSYFAPPEDSGGRRQFFAMVESRGSAELVNRAWVIAQVSDRLGDAARVAALLTDPGRGPESAPAVGHHLAAWVDVARGRWSAADSEFSRTTALDARMGLVERVWLGSMPMLARDTAWLRRTRAELLEWTPGPHGPKTDYLVDWRLPPWLTPHAKVYALGLLSARLGDSAAASRYAAQLDAARDSHDSLGLLHDLALEVRALNAAEREQWGTCLTVLERQGLRGSAPVADDAMTIFSRRAFGRLLRAEALFHLGRDQEALRWYGTFWLHTEFALLAPIQLREGEIYERQGDAREAVAHYRRFLARWDEADSLYQPLVRNVGARVARLTRELSR